MHQIKGVQNIKLSFPHEYRVADKCPHCRTGHACHGTPYYRHGHMVMIRASLYCMQVFNVFRAFGRITIVEGPWALNVLAPRPAPGPGGPFQRPPVIMMAPAQYVQARVRYASRDDAIMAWSTFAKIDLRVHMVRSLTALLLCTAVAWISPGRSS